MNFKSSNYSGYGCGNHLVGSQVKLKLGILGTLHVTPFTFTEVTVHNRDTFVPTYYNIPQTAEENEGGGK